MDAAAPAERVLRIADPSSQSESRDNSLIALAKRSTKRLPLTIEASPIHGAVAIVKAIENNELDVGMASVDVTYLAYHGLIDRDPAARNLRGIGLIQVTTIHLLASPFTPVSSVNDLQGRRVGVGDGSGLSVLVKPVLEAHRVPSDRVTIETLETDRAFARLMDGSLDVLFYRNTYPNSRVAQAIRGGAKLLPLAGPGIERLRHEYPFVRLAVVPGGTYPGQALPLRTIAIDTVLVCRRDLDEALVYELTRAFLTELPRLSWLGVNRLRDRDRAPAVPIPLHDGAARYYREVELLQ